jgi:cation transport ATPase
LKKQKINNFIDRNASWLLPVLIFIILIILLWFGYAFFPNDSLNEYGDFLAGIFAPMFFVAILYQNYRGWRRLVYLG